MHDDARTADDRPAPSLRRRAPIWILGSMLGSMLSVACGTPADPPEDAGRGDLPDARPPIPMDASEGPSDAGTRPSLVGLQLTPTDAETVVRNGVASPVTFQAAGVRADGTLDATVRVTFSLSAATLGSISNAGEFLANGQAGGQVEVSATLTTSTGDLRATASLIVRIETDVLGASVTEEMVSRVGSAPASMASAPRMLYPLDQAVMPQNVFPPSVQWSPEGAEGDVFRVRLSKPHVQVTSYVAPTTLAAEMHRWLPDPGDWRALTDSDLESPVSVTIERFDVATGELTPSDTRVIHISRGALSGTLYYWSVQEGKVMRLDPAAGTAEPMTLGGGCVACHSVSRDGRYLAASRENDLHGAVFDLTRGEPEPTFVSGPARRFAFSTFNPDSTRLLVNHYVTEGSFWRDTMSFVLLDPQTGDEVPATGLPGPGVTTAEWSPDGESVALIGNVVSELGFSFVYESGDLAVMPVGPGDSFGPLVTLHEGASLAGAPEGGSSDMHPTWSPDSNLIAFAHGTRGRATTGGTRVREYLPGALYLTERAGGPVYRLDRANGGPTGTGSYWPTMGPFITLTPDGTGRYFWMVFFDPRPYGNHPTTSPPRSQLWVTAIDATPIPGTDPSHVPYWLPGQDPTQHNIDAHWTAQACRANGAECASSSECCSDVCLSPDGAAPAVCTPPPPTSCRAEGLSCGGNEDCCLGLTCVGNSCVTELI